MESQKPNSVKTIGLFIALFSGLTIFGNIMGGLVITLIVFGDDQNSPAEISDFNLIEYLLYNYVYMCIAMVAIGALYLIGGLNIRKFKLWANKLVSYISAILILIIWSIMIALALAFGGQDDMEMLGIMAITNALIWSVPFGLLIWFLNRKNIKKHFD